jgi:asparagine synthase (glutamine-hydrolysing)
MCGIAGIIDVGSTNGASISREVLTTMTDSIAHRGPDAGSYHFEAGVGLGHRRLSIIDIASGHQPMSNEDDSVWVVFNGEIYNFAEVRTELELLGHRFKTNGSDTEIILHGWEQWGVECVHRFRGMFAFVLWDRNQKKLFAARDRLGVKPLFYAILPNGHFVFGSELKAVATHPSLNKDIDPQAIEDYLSLGYVPDPKSIYKSVRKLAPAHFLLIEAGKYKTATPKRYWAAPFGAETSIDAREAEEQLDQLVKESIKLRMISEVPLGAFLSGGVDSSLVVAAMSHVSNSPVKTCSIGFEAEGFDETVYARQVAEQYKTDHSEFKVSTSDINLFDQLIDLYDEPFADASAVATYRVCELARRRVTVALSGDGGDETFCGYRRYRLHLGEERVRGLLPLAIRKPVFKTLGALYPKLSNAPQWMRAKSTLQALARDTVEAYFHSVSIMPRAINESLKSPKFLADLGGYTALEVFRAAATDGPDHPMSLIQHIDYQTYLPGDINVKVDRASMAHSLEVREPLMDHKVVEWAAKLNRDLHIQPTVGKKLLKSLARRQIPTEIIDRPKRGFTVPINDWFESSFGERFGQSLNNSPLLSYVSRDVVQNLLTDHRAKKADHSRALWSLALLNSFLLKQ